MDPEVRILSEGGLQAFFKPFPENHRARFITARRLHNHTLLKTLSLILFAFSLLFEGQHLFFSDFAPALAGVFLRYAIIYASTAVFSIMFYILAISYQDPTSRRSSSIHWLYSSLLMTATVLLTWTDLHITRDFTAIQFGLMGLGLCFSTTLIGYAVIFGSALAAIQILVTFTDVIALNLADRLVLSLMACMGMVIAALVEGERRRGVAIAIRLEEANARLEELSFTDKATGAHNMRYILDLLKSKLGKPQESAEIPLSMVLVEVADFKKIIEDRGRVAGDSVLRDLIALIRGIMGPSDVIARYADDEFVLLLPQGSLSYAQSLANKIRKDASIVRCSCCAVQAGPDDGPESFLARADAALFAEKRKP
jgi:diguanylate cyclase (GGDEF)-like protein